VGYCRQFGSTVVLGDVRFEHFFRFCGIDPQGFGQAV
jgi:hypothetical protein